MDLPQDVLFIMDMLAKKGFESFVVGGCVRDYIMSDKAKDFDITTDALPIDIKSIFSHTIDTGIKHGTVTVVLNKKNYEITTYRIDGKYKDNRHPESVHFTKKIEEDLSRRDFTINAIAYSPKKGYVDPFLGLQDIKRGLIKGVLVPDTRFKEDALRMMRAVRFASQLDFDIEDATMLAIKENAHLVKNISAERIREEFLKLINSDYIEKFFVLKESGLLQHILPEFNIIFNDYNKNIKILKFLKKEYRLSFLLTNILKESAINILKRLKFDNKTINENKIILSNFNNSFINTMQETRKNMSKIKPCILKKILHIKVAIYKCMDNTQYKQLEDILCKIDYVLQKNECYTLKDLAINGNDLKNNGIKDGIQIGEILNKCLNIVLNEPEKNLKHILIKEALKK